MQNSQEAPTPAEVGHSCWKSYGLCLMACGLERREEGSDDNRIWGCHHCPKRPCPASRDHQLVLKFLKSMPTHTINYHGGVHSNFKTFLWQYNKILAELILKSYSAIVNISKNLSDGGDDGRGVGGHGLHLSPRKHQEYTFRHRTAYRTPAESGHAYLTSGKEYIGPHKTQ